MTIFLAWGENGKLGPLALDTLLEIMLTVSLRRNAKYNYQDGWRIFSARGKSKVITLWTIILYPNCIQTCLNFIQIKLGIVNSERKFFLSFSNSSKFLDVSHFKMRHTAQWTKLKNLIWKIRNLTFTINMKNIRPISIIKVE